MWTTAFIAAYTLYRHHRLLDAILLVGTALIVNMSATLSDLFGHLVLFVAAAFLLWLRVALVTRQEGWLRRRVNENAEVPAADHAQRDRLHRRQHRPRLDPHHRGRGRAAD